jgi:hypothetical protein
MEETVWLGHICIHIKLLQMSESLLICLGIIYSEFNSLKPNLVVTIFKYSLINSKRTQPVTITQIDYLTLFNKIIAVYSENCMKPTHTRCVQNAELLTVKAAEIYN